MNLFYFGLLIGMLIGSFLEGLMRRWRERRSYAYTYTCLKEGCNFKASSSHATIANEVSIKHDQYHKSQEG